MTAPDAEGYRPCAGCDSIGESCRSVGRPAAGSGASPARDGDTAERIVAAAVRIAQTSPMSLREATNALLEVGGVCAALEAVRDLHQPERHTEYNVPCFDEFDRPTRSYRRCRECKSRSWPCSTAAAIDASGVLQ